MEDPWIGKMMFIGIVVAVVWVIGKLLSSKSEVARRIKVTLLCLLALAVTAGVFAAIGPIGLIVTLVALGVIIWIARGA